MLKLLRHVAATAAMLCAPVSAHAAEYLFTLGGGYEASFRIDTDVAPAVVDDNRFEYHDVAGSRGGADVVIPVVSFFAPVSGGGMNLWDGDGNVVFDSFGTDLFGGTTAAPTFAPGRFSLWAVGTDLSDAPAFTLDIAAVPEPSTWLAMIVGIGAIGAVVRRRRVSVAVAA